MNSSKLTVLGICGLVVAVVVANAPAEPKGAQVTAGRATIQTNGSQTVITAGNRAIINYSSFNIGAGETVRFVQPSASSTVLNRILGAAPTRIDGMLLANGRVFFVNPAGMIFGNGCIVNVGALYAAAGHISDRDFLDGTNRFTGLTGTIVNAGLLRGRQIHLAGREVTNTGTILAPRGVVTLSAGDEVYLAETRDGHILVKVDSSPAVAGAPGTTPAASPLASPLAAGDIYSLALSGTSSVKASQVNVQGAATGSSVTVAGTIDASNAAGKGGSVKVLGEKVTLAGATVDASGSAGGGQVLVGGDFRGANPSVPNAAMTYVDPTSAIRADATVNGDGGKVVVWSDKGTWFHGSISARGGPAGGNGGFVEVSGHYLDFQGQVCTLAPRGSVGVLLLDPTDLTVDNSGDNNVSAGTPFTPTGGSSVLTWASIDGALAGGDVIVTTVGSPDTGVETGKITIGGAGAYNRANKLTFDAAGDLDITAGNTIANTGNGDLVLKSAGAITISAAVTVIGNLTIDSGGAVTQSAALSAAGLELLGAGSFTLVNPNNTVTSLAGDVTGSISYRDVGGFTIGTVNTVGLRSTAGSITLNGGGLVNQTQRISAAGGLELRGTSYTLTGANNVANTLAADVTGSLNYTDSAAGGFVVGSVGTTHGLTAGAASNITLTSAGPVTQGAAANERISSSGLRLLGAGSYTLDNTGNVVTTLAANLTGAGAGLTYVDSNGLTVGTVTTAGITTNAGPVSVSTVNGVLTIDDNINAGASSVSLVAGSSGNDNSLTINNVTITGTGGGMTLVGDNMSINTSASLVATGQTVTLRQFEDGTAIHVAGADAAGALGLTDGELDTVAGSTVAIGNANSGAVTVSANVTAGTKNVSVTTGAGSDITFSGATAQLDTTGNVTLTTSGAGGIKASGGGRDVDNAAGLTVNSGTGGVGTSADRILTNVAALGGTSTGPVYVTENSGMDITGLSGTTVSLNAGGAVTQSGAITATALELLGAAATYTLTLPAGNSVGTLAGTTGAVSFINATSLAVGSAGGSTGLDSSANVSLTALTGDINGGATLTADNLTLVATAGGIGIATPLGTDVASPGTFTITTGGVGAAGNVSLVEANSLNTTRVAALNTDVSAQLVSLTSTAGPITLGANIGNTTDNLALVAAAGNIVGGAGTATANNLTLNAAGGIGIGTAVNAASNSLSLTTGGAGNAGNITVLEANPLNIGLIATAATAQTVSLTTAVGPITLVADIGNATDNLALIASTGNIVGGAGTAIANNLTLTASAGGIGIGTPVNTNTSGTLALTTGGVGALGNISVVEANSLNTSRVTLSTPVSAQSVSLTSSAGPLTLGANIGNTTDDLALAASAGNIVGGAGTATAANLALSAPAGGIGIGTAVDTSVSGSFSLTTGGAGAAGNISLVEAAALNTTQIALLSTAPSAQTVSLTSTAGSITVGAPVGNPTDSLALIATAGNIVGGAPILADNLTLTASAGGIGVGTPITSVTTGTLALTTGGAGAAGNITLVETNSLNTNRVSLSTPASAQTVSLTCLSPATITLGANIGNHTDDLTLIAAAGDINGGAGTAFADNLTLTATAGGIGIAAPVNSDIVGNLTLTTGGIGAAGNIAVVEANALNTNRVTLATDVSVQLVSLTSTAGPLTLGAAIGNVTDDLALVATAGNIVSGAGTATAHDLALTATAGGIGLGSPVLTSTTGTLALTSGGTAAAGNIGVVETNALNTNRVAFTTAAGTAETVNLVSTAGPVTVGGNLGNATDNLVLTASAGDIVGGAGALTANALTLNAPAGGIGIGTPVNTNTTGSLIFITGGVGALGNIAVIEANALDSGRVLLVTPASAQTVALTSTAGPITVGGNIGNPVDDLTLTATAGNIVGGAGALTAGNLALLAPAGGIGIGTAVNTNTTGTITLTSGGVGAAGNIAIVEANALNVSRAIVTTDASAQLVSLASTAGPITLDAAIGNATDSLALIAASGNIVGGVGTATANNLTLTASAGGIGIGTPVNTATTGAVALTTGGAAANGNIRVIEANALNTNRVTLATAGSAQDVTLTSTAGPITIGGNLGNATDSLALIASAGDIVGGAGTLTADDLGLTATLGGIGVGAAVKSNATGLLSLTTGGVAAAGNITVVEANALNTNRVALTTDVSAQTVSLTSTAGPLTAGAAIGNAVDDLTLVTSAGNIVLGNTVTANKLLLNAAAAISQTGGNIAATSLGATAVGNVGLTQAANAVTTLAGTTAGDFSFTSGGGFDIGTVNPVGLTAGGNVVLTAGGLVTQSQAIHSAGLELHGAGPFTLNLAGGNQVTTLAANSGAINFLNATGFTVGALGVTGITSTGGVALQAVTGDINVPTPIDTRSAIGNGGNVGIIAYGGSITASDIRTSSSAAGGNAGYIGLQAATGNTTSAQFGETPDGTVLLTGGRIFQANGGPGGAGGIIYLNPNGRAGSPSTASIGADGDITLSGGRIVMGASEKFTVNGNLTINVTGPAQLADLTALTITVNAASITAVGRGPGKVLAESPGASALGDDAGTDFVANTLLFNKPVAGTARFSAFNAAGSVVPGQPIQAYPQTITPAELYAPVGSPLPSVFLDLRAEGPVQVSLATALATALPKQEVEVPITETVSSALESELRQLGIYVRKLTTDELLQVFQGGWIYNDLLKSKVLPSPKNELVAGEMAGDPDAQPSAYQVSAGRLPADLAGEAVKSYRQLYWKKVVDKAGKEEWESRAAEIASRLDAAAAAFRQASGAKEIQSAAFMAFLTKDPKWAGARAEVRALQNLFRQIDLLGLTPKELEISKNALLFQLKTRELTRKELRGLVDSAIGPALVALPVK